MRVHKHFVHLLYHHSDCKVNIRKYFHFKCLDLIVAVLCVCVLVVGVNREELYLSLKQQRFQQAIQSKSNLDIYMYCRHSLQTQHI